MSVTYGLEIQEEDDPYLEVAVRADRSLTAIAKPGAFLVDLFPSLKYVPAWMPGASFKRKTRVWEKDAKDMLNIPFQAAKQLLVSSPPYLF
jgi:hypothetical protein